MPRGVAALWMKRQLAQQASPARLSIPPGRDNPEDNGSARAVSTGHGTPQAGGGVGSLGATMVTTTAVEIHLPFFVSEMRK